MRIKKLAALAISVVMCLQTLPTAAFASEPAVPETSVSNYITGSGVKVSYDEVDETLTLYRMDGTTAIQMSKPSDMGYPIIGGQAVQDFAHVSCIVERDATGLMGAGERMTITSQSASTGLTRTYVLETSDTEEGLLYTTTTYQAGTSDVTPEWVVENEFELFGAEDRIWSYNGGGEGPLHYYDTLQKIDLTDSSMFSRENKQDDTAASIPVANIYIAGGGITVGDASATRREVHTPVQETDDSAKVSIKWPGRTIPVGTTVEIGQSFMIIHPGDYFNGLRGYKNAMEHLGVIMRSNIADRSYDLRWESWGWGFNWTIDLIIGKLDELQAAGVKQITLDDGWYNHAGDWALNPNKFPNGDADMKRLTDAIHARGMTAILWWRPCDGGTNSTLYREHPEYYVQGANGNVARLTLPGGGASTSLGYALCPASAGAIASQTAFIDQAMNVWGFDGFKGDYVWGMPKCYNTSHNHLYPMESTEKQSELYRTAYEAMVENDPDVFNMLCNCGTPQDFYSLPYMTQVATADSTSLDQTRTRAKAYKALMGDYFPVTTDHNSVWYPSTIGTGSVIIEKRAHIGANMAEYARWLGIANEVQLHKGRFIGDLYSYGFDPYETYVVEQDGIMYYAFYRDGNKYSPSGYPDIELKGLDPNKLYRVVDYINDRVVATNLRGDNAVFNDHFSSYLLVKAVEISEPDPEPVDPDWGFTSVDDRNPALTYTGVWNNDSNPHFYEGTAKYTNSTDASVEFTFTGTAIRWYGQKDTNFGTADIYLDDTLMETANANGPMATGQLLFEALNLTAATHTIKIVRKTGVIDIDRFAYQPATPEATYTKVDATSEEITYVGNWQLEHDDGFYMGNAKTTMDVNDYAEFTFYGTAIRWFGKKLPVLSTADVYLDGVFMESPSLYGTDNTIYCLFERTGLPEGEHTLRIVLSKYAVSIDYLSYANENTGSNAGGTYQLVDDRDTALVYTGLWHDDSNTAFHEETARYTNTVDASVEFTFTGSAIRWYGQRETNFGTAQVYLDGNLVKTVDVNGPAASGQLLFERTDLTQGEHTIRIVCASDTIDLDYLSYASA